METKPDRTFIISVRPQGADQDTRFQHPNSHLGVGQDTQGDR